MQSFKKAGIGSVMRNSEGIVLASYAAHKENVVSSVDAGVCLSCSR